MPDYLNSQWLEGYAKISRKEELVEKKILLIVTALMFTAQNHALAEPPVITDYKERLIIEACRLTSEKPHLSEHVPGTVNVTGRTMCSGISAGRKIRVTVTLTRLDGGNTPPITVSRTGSKNLIVNVAMPCIWSRNQAKIEYRVKTIHKMSNGKNGITENGAFLKC